ESGTGGELLLRQAGEDLLEGERIVSQQLGVRPHVRERRGGRLVVTLDRRGLAVPAHTVVLDLDVDDLRGVLRRAGDDERVGETERDDPSRDLHAGTLRTPRP